MTARSEFFDDDKSKNTATVERLSKRAVALERDITALEEALKEAKAEQLKIRRELLPDAMAEIGFTEFTLLDGSGVKVKNFVAGTLPKTPIERTFALRLLEEHGGEALIKNDLTVSFEKREHNKALALAEELKSAGYDAVIESTVHPQSLAAWCREKVREGATLDFDKLGMFVGRDTTITLPEKQS